MISELAIMIVFLSFWAISLIGSLALRDIRLFGLSTIFAFIIIPQGLIKSMTSTGDYLFFPLVWIAKIFLIIFLVQAMYCVKFIYSNLFKEGDILDKPL